MFCIFSAAFVHVLACESIDFAADAYCCSVRPMPLHAKLSNLLLGIALLELGGTRTKSAWQATSARCTSGATRQTTKRKQERGGSSSSTRAPVEKVDETSFGTCSPQTS